MKVEQLGDSLAVVSCSALVHDGLLFAGINLQWYGSDAIGVRPGRCEVAGSTPPPRNDSGHVVHTRVLLSSSCISRYWCGVVLL